MFRDFPESSQVHYLEGNLPTEFILNLGHYIRACVTPVRNFGASGSFSLKAAKER